MAKSASRSKKAVAVIEDEILDTPETIDEIEEEFMEAMNASYKDEEMVDGFDAVEEGGVELLDIVTPENFNIKDIPGIGPSIAKKLAESGFANVRALATLNSKMLVEESGIGEKTAQKIIQAAQEVCKIDFQTADIVFEKRKELGRIVTGCQALDEMFGGGIESGAITELFGEFRTGKTQIAHQACVNVQLPLDQGGLGGKALYIDTEGTFRPERIAQVAIGKKMEVRETLKNVIFARAYNSEHQVSILRQARRLVEKENVKLIVVDSIISHFRSEYLGLGSLGPRQQLLNMHLHQIQQLCDTYGIAAIVTNQVQAKPDIFFGNPIIAAGGNILAHGSTYRVYLRKGKGDTRVAKMVDAPGLPEAEAAFKIVEAGIEDAE